MPGGQDEDMSGTCFKDDNVAESELCSVLWDQTAGWNQTSVLLQRPDTGMCQVLTLMGCSRNETGVFPPPPVSYEQPALPTAWKLPWCSQAPSSCLPVGLCTRSHPGAGGGNFLGPAWVQKTVLPGDSTYPPGLGAEGKFATLSEAWAA